jgi:tRNA-specific 2-thiouridylase
VHAKKDSTGICFIGERPFREFLSTYLPANPGPMVTPDGRQIGEHAGLMYYTLGQRQGLGIGGRQESADAPWYVVAKDLANNTLTVAQGESPLLFSSGLTAVHASWIGPAPSGLDAGLRCNAKVRYRQADQRCTVAAMPDGALDVVFDEDQRAVAPGQFVVFYDGERCLGGAAIDELVASADAPNPVRAASIC